MSAKDEVTDAIFEKYQALVERVPELERQNKELNDHVARLELQHLEDQRLINQLKMKPVAKKSRALPKPQD